VYTIKKKAYNKDIGDKMNWKRKGRKRLAIDIPEELHEAIKIYAARRNITMTKWILRACFARQREESKFLD